MKHSKGFLKLVNAAKKKIKEITPQKVHQRMVAGENIALLDIREDHEWENGHIVDATHLSKGLIERDIEHNFPDKSEEIVLYCGGGFRSALSADNLKKMGYKNVYSMRGGWRKWNELSYPIIGKRPDKH